MEGVLVEGVLVEGVVADGALVEGVLVEGVLVVGVLLEGVLVSSPFISVFSEGVEFSLEVSSLSLFVPPTSAPQSGQKVASFEMPTPQLEQYFSAFSSLPPQAAKDSTIAITKITAKILFIFKHP